MLALGLISDKGDEGQIVLAGEVLDEVESAQAVAPVGRIGEAGGQAEYVHNSSSDSGVRIAAAFPGSGLGGPGRLGPP